MANKTEMKHFSHRHPLILNEVYIAKEGDVCHVCNEEIVSCRSFVYTCSNNTSSSSSTTDSKSSSSCANFLLHKSCAELPPTIKHPHHHHVSLQLYSREIEVYRYCSICGCRPPRWYRSGGSWSGFFYACLDDKTYDLDVCARCAMASLEEEDRIYHQHPAHPQHTLKFVHHLSSFRCVACKVDDNIKDLSYICTKCLFWVIHKSCADASSSCVEFLLHKSCAELPRRIKHPNHDDVSLYLHSSNPFFRFHCSICGSSTERPRRFVYLYGHPYVCIRCGMESVLLLRSSIYDQHPAHPQHALKFVQYLSSFKCHACRVDDNIRDLSYICTKCPFWVIHKTCADAPASFQFQFHDKHPLQLSFSLPQRYQNFPQYCRFCSKQLFPRDWLYYCPKCRFFAHFHCARSNIDKIRLIEEEIYDSEVVHLPAADESSADQLAEQFVTAMSTVITTNCFRHPAHKQHDLQLMTINELNINQKHDDEALLLLCDGCVKPIRTDHQDNQFYGCVPCNFFMHKACAGLPREIDQHHLIHPAAAAAGTRLYADYSFCSSLRFFRCFGCGIPANGISFHDGNGNRRVHIGCLTLPKKIKHEAHTHQLHQVISTEEDEYCRACAVIAGESRYKYCCEKCSYYICARCIMKPKTSKHPWDPHPLSLIYDPGMVSSDHEHEFECEYCSQEINCTNRWFYHCSECDLSFHLLGYNGYACFEWSRHSFFSSIKYGATVIIDKLHHHSLTYVLNKKVRSCEKCFSRRQLGRPVLECVPCKVIFCMSCYSKD